MATVVLQTVGAAVGGAIGGPFGAILGRAAGAAAGYAIDQSYLAKDQVVQGPRLENSRLLSAVEGAPIPKVYGRNRIAGQVIWATTFEEVASTERSGGKGTGNTSSTTSFSYFANFAIGLCEGPISGLRRVWADGKELDLTKVEYRFYNGDEDQEPDPLIEAKQGLGNAPAYRGTAYIVFESLPLENYGNRIPQLTFEIIRSIGELEKKIKSMTIIPGSTEFGYDPQFISNGGGAETYVSQNRHTSIAISNWEASMDELQMLCPNLESISLVVAWFGDDLRAGECKIRPGVTSQIGINWNVAGLKRHRAYLLSQVNGRPAFGGTPDDASILRAIADLKARGLKVVLYPFIMMDIPTNNTLPHLSGSGRQPVYPWRGEISCFPAPGYTNTVDKTAASRTQIDAFNTQYRAFIIHYANLCSLAGGVDGFLIGSELRGLTRIRDGEGKFPFVEMLISLANQCRNILGSNTFITYGADWSEYFGYQPQDGTGDVLFNLDTLWTSPQIDAVGIDNYMPLSDWRDEGDPDNTLARSNHSIEYLKSNVGRGEGYDWYYASADDRLNGDRTPITDGQGEPWIYRYKDIHSWWSRRHYNRINGIRQNSPTTWIPQSKPIIFTELGCPAVDKGTNQPNVFFDPKSDQSALPYFSSGGRDDLIQRRYLEASYEFWNEDTNNPRSNIYDGHMIDVDNMTPWAWDARPFPWFPLQLDVWSDGDNWHLGHWLTGRFGGCSLQDLVATILSDYGYENFEVTLDSIVDGYIIPTQSSVRGALEPLLELHNVQVLEDNGKIIFRDQHYADHVQLGSELLVQEESQFEKTSKRNNEIELPAEAIVTHGAIFSDYEEIATKSRRLEGGSNRQISLQLPITVPEETASKLANVRLRSDWIGRQECNVSLPITGLAIDVGDIVEFTDIKGQEWQVDHIEGNYAQNLSLRSVMDFPALSSNVTDQSYANIVPNFYGQPDTVLLDLPLLKSTDQNRIITHIAAAASPWAGSYNVYSSIDENGFSRRVTLTARSQIGSLTKPLFEGVVGRWDYNNSVIVTLPYGSFESVSRLSILNGINVLAVECLNGGYELLQFSNAELLNNGNWKLSNLLRAQLGTEAEMLSGTFIGSKVVLLNEAIYPLELQDNETGISQNWRVGPSRDNNADATYTSQTHTNNARSRVPLSPVHLRCKNQDTGHYEFSWIRRGAVNADAWEGQEIPLDVFEEKYRVRILDIDNNIKREEFSPFSGYLYSNQSHIADFGQNTSSFYIEIAQLNNTGVAGASKRLQIFNT